MSTTENRSSIGSNGLRLIIQINLSLLVLIFLNYLARVIFNLAISQHLMWVVNLAWWLSGLTVVILFLKENNTKLVFLLASFLSLIGTLFILCVLFFAGVNIRPPYTEHRAVGVRLDQSAALMAPRCFYNVIENRFWIFESDRGTLHWCDYHWDGIPEITRKEGEIHISMALDDESDTVFVFQTQ